MHTGWKSHTRRVMHTTETLAEKWMDTRYPASHKIYYQVLPDLPRALARTSCFSFASACFFL